MLVQKLALHLGCGFPLDIANNYECRYLTYVLQILECVTINLTLVYAALAYANIKKTDVGNILVSQVVPSHCVSVLTAIEFYVCR